MTTVLRFVDDGRLDKPWTPVDGAYLLAFDPNGREGRGVFVWTDEPEWAMKFETVGAAMDEWRRTSTTHPTRDDGKPNRPLTAFTLVTEEVHAN